MLIRINKKVIKEYVKSLVVAGIVCLSLNKFGNDYIRSKINFVSLFFDLTFLFIGLLCIYHFVDQ